MRLRMKFFLLMLVSGLLPLLAGSALVYQRVEEEGALLDAPAATAALVQVRDLSLSFMLGTAALLLLTSVVVSRRVLTPLKKTVRLLESMARGEGDLNERLEACGRDEIGELARWFNAYMDKIQQVYRTLAGEIEKRRRAQEEIEASSRRFRALIENTSDIIAIVDSAHRFTYLSPSFERALGEPIEARLKSSLLELVHPEEQHRLKVMLERLQGEAGTAMRVEHRLRHTGGEYLDYEITATTYAEDTLLGGTVLNLRDVTARRQAQRILREYSEQLERDVTQRTIDLEEKTKELTRALNELKSAQNQLVLNEKMASLGALTAGIAHEIKNPLNFVNNFADLTRELTQELGEELEKRRETLNGDGGYLCELVSDIQLNAQKIAEHGKRADSIVRNMLLHSRGSKGERQCTNLNALLDEYVKLAYHGMRAHDARFNVDFDLHYDPELEPFEVAPQDLSRVFLNLLNNACYAAYQRALKEPGFKPVLTVKTQSHGDEAIIRIRDNGEGIPEELRDKIFNPFFTTKPAGQGTGLGLSISHDIIVQEHRGELRVESEPGQYTEFIVVLPKAGCPKETEATNP